MAEPESDAATASHPAAGTSRASIKSRKSVGGTHEAFPLSRKSEQLPMATAKSIRRKSVGVGAYFGMKFMDEDHYDDIRKVHKVDDEHDIKGPVEHRACRDFLCCVIFVAWIVAYFFLMYDMVEASDLELLQYGIDYRGFRCGYDEEVRNKPDVYYPDIAQDVVNDPSMSTLYGICTEECPLLGEVVIDPGYENITAPRREGALDQRASLWFASAPTLDIAGRCYPYEDVQRWDTNNMCAFPRCTGDGETMPTGIMDVCGLASEGAERYWVTGQPESYLIDGWRNESIPEEIIAARLEIYKDYEPFGGDKDVPECEFKVLRGVTIEVQDPAKAVTQELFERYLGTAVRELGYLYNQIDIVLLLGVVGSLIAVCVIIILYPWCIRAVMIILILGVFAGLGALNYVLYLKAGYDPGTFHEDAWAALRGEAVDGGVPTENLEDLENIRDIVTSSEEDPRLREYYEYAAWAMSVLICILACLACFLKQNLEILIQLTTAAAEEIRKIPSLLIFPWFIVGSMVCFELIYVYGGAAIMLAPDTAIEKYSVLLQLPNATEPETISDVRRGLVGVTIFTGLWVFYYHLAIFAFVVAGATANWYFYRDDHEKNGAVTDGGCHFGLPTLISLWRAFRYHAGTMAIGSFLVAAVAMMRVILEYIDQQTKAEQESNRTLKLSMAVCRCILWCFHKCVKYLTTLAYISSAVTGKNFCKSAFSAFGLVAGHPVQLALITFSTWALTGITCLTVPAFALFAGYFLLESAGYFAASIVILVLSLGITYMAVSVFDLIITSLFLCALRDKEYYNMAYAPEGLAKAFGLEKGEPPKEVEMEEKGKE